MKRLFLICLILVAVSAKEAKKPVITPAKLAVKPAVKPAAKPVILPKVPPIFMCNGKRPLDISNAMMDIYKYMQKNEKEKAKLHNEISYLQLELMALKKQVAK